MHSDGNSLNPNHPGLSTLGIKFSFTIFGLLLTGSMTVSAVAQEQSNTGNLPKIKVETVASHLEIPWSMAFANDGRIFFTERTGNLRLIDKDGKLVEEPVGKINVAAIGEGGLLGIALDPNFEKNHFIYVYYTYSDFLKLYNKVSRFTEKDNKISDEQVILDKIPASSIHDGGRIKFGPDERLYIGVGDASDRDSAQDTDMLSGKILRINPDGSIPSDNPFPNSPVYSYGNRNPQGIDWDPITGKLVETEHGPSGEMGLSAHDEINVIEAGKNYGWPKVIGNPNDPNFVDPIFQTGDSTWAPSGATFYSGDKIPEWKGKYLVATLRGTHLEVFGLDLDNKKVVSNESMFDGIYGRLRDVEQSPDGYLYLLTSNRDGRGSPSTDDDRILKIVPDGSSPAVPEFDSSFMVFPIASAFMIALFCTARYIIKRQSTIR